MYNLSAVYLVSVGPSFYIGSARRVGSRISEHRCKLARGEHHNPRLQAAWNHHQAFDAAIIEECPEAELRAREDGRIKEFFGTEGCCNTSSSAFYNTG